MLATYSFFSLGFIDTFSWFSHLHHIYISAIFHDVERLTVLRVFLPRATGGRVEGRLLSVSSMQAGSLLTLPRHKVDQPTVVGVFPPRATRKTL